MKYNKDERKERKKGRRKECRNNIETEQTNKRTSNTNEQVQWKIIMQYSINMCPSSASVVNLLRPQVGRSRQLFIPQVSRTRPYILASWFDLFQRRSLEDTFETHLT